MATRSYPVTFAGRQAHVEAVYDRKKDSVRIFSLTFVDDVKREANTFAAADGSPAVWIFHSSVPPTKTPSNTWVQLATKRGLPCHVGRVGTFPRVLWARKIGATSIDSSLPLWSYGNFYRFLEALQQPLEES